MNRHLCCYTILFRADSEFFKTEASRYGPRLFTTLNTSTADVLGLFYVRLWELPIFVAMACAIGAMGAGFVTANTRVVYALRQHCIPNSSRYR